MKKIIEKNLLVRQILGVISLIGVIANILFRFAFKTYGDITFWIVIIVFAIIAFPVMNWLKK